MFTRSERFWTYVVLFGFSVLAVYPLLSILLLALNEPGSAVSGIAIPTHLSIDAFVAAWTQGDFGAALASSTIVAVPVVVISLVLSIFTGYAFGTMRFVGSGALFYVLLVGILFPYEALIAPLYYDFRAVGLTNNYLALILPQIGFSVSFGTVWMRGFFRSSPRALIEAARVDGAGSWTILWRVLAPLARPSILTLAVLVFMNTWNEFLLALVLIQNDSMRTAPVVLAFFSGGQHIRDPILIGAAAVLVAAPVVIVYSLLQRQFLRGLLEGAISGE
jgi:raffinose/stachyose/melibiose transport system permease protein